MSGTLPENKMNGDKTLNAAREALTEAVDNAVAFFTDVDESLFDGHQTAREVLSHFVYWHRVYARVARAILDDRSPALSRGSFAVLNTAAAERYAPFSLPTLVRGLSRYQRLLDDALRRLPDASVDFPIKLGARHWSARQRIRRLAAHIEEHLARLERAERHGEAWIAAYYPLAEIGG